MSDTKKLTQAAVKQFINSTICDLFVYPSNGVMFHVALRCGPNAKRYGVTYRDDCTMMEFSSSSLEEAVRFFNEKVAENEETNNENA